MTPILLALLSHAIMPRKANEKRRGRRHANALSNQASLQQLENRDLMARVTWALEDGGNGHQYEYVRTPTTFLQARALADSMGGHLATISSFAEGRFIDNSVKSAGGIEDYWIGGFGGPSVFADDRWEWVTGEPMQYQAWTGGEPNDFQGVGESALHVWQGGLWNDRAMTVSLGFVVEYDGLRDRGLSDGPHQTNDAPALATDLGSLGTLTIVSASLREVADVDYYKFTPQTDGLLSVRIPDMPYRDASLFGIGSEFLPPVVETPGYSDYQIQVTAGQTYQFGFGSSRVVREFPYQIVIAPPGTELPPAPVTLPTTLEASISNRSELLANGETRYYGLTDAKRAIVTAQLDYDKSQGRLSVELVNPGGDVLARGQSFDGFDSLYHVYSHDLLLGAANQPIRWPIYLKVTAQGGDVRYTLNASAQTRLTVDPASIYDLGSVGAGSSLSVTLQKDRVFRFTAAESGPLHLLISSPLLPQDIALRDAAGQTVILSRSALLNAVPTKSMLLSFNVEQGQVYDLQGFSRLPVGRTTFHMLFFKGTLNEVEPNDLPEAVNRFGMRSEWVISANSADSEGGNGSRTDEFEVIAGQTGLLAVGLSNGTRDAVAIYVNGRKLPLYAGGGRFDNYVQKGDVIRYEVTEPRDINYSVFGRIIPVLLTDDVYEYDALHGVTSNGFSPYLRDPLLHDKDDVDNYVLNLQPGVYVQSIETPMPEKYLLRVYDAASGELVATGAIPSPGEAEPTGLAARFVSYGRRYRVEVRASGDSFTQTPYRPRIALSGQARNMLMRPDSAELDYFNETALLGGFNINFVGSVEISLTTANPGGAPFGAANVGLRDASGVLTTFQVTDSSSPIRLDVRPGLYLLGIETRLPQSFLAKVTFVRTPGDVNGDGKVNLADFAILRSNFDTTAAPYSSGDLNGDGRIDIRDFAVLRRNFNRRA